MYFTAHLLHTPHTLSDAQTVDRSVDRDPDVGACLRRRARLRFNTSVGSGVGYSSAGTHTYEGGSGGNINHILDVSGVREGWGLAHDEGL